MLRTLCILLSLAAVSLFAAAGKEDGAKVHVARTDDALRIDSSQELACDRRQTAAKDPAPDPKLSGGEDAAAAKKILLDARDAYVHGQYANAIAIAKRAVKAQPNQAWRLIGASSCFLKDRNGALQAWNQLDSQGRSFLKYVCSRNAITIP